MSVIAFIPKSEVEARENVKEFVRFAREDLTVFGPDLDFDAPEWPVGVQVWGPRTRTQSLVFRKFGGFSRRPAELMSEPFASFVKAYIRYTYGLRPTKTLTGKIAAFRGLEVALDGRMVWEIDTGILNEAARDLRERWDSNHAAHCGLVLEEVAEFLDKNRMAPNQLSWRNPIRLNAAIRHSLTKEAAQKRKDLLPSKAALNALPIIFQTAKTTPDRIISGIIGLLVAAPERISEVLSLPANCEVEEDGKYGIAWRPAKGGEPMVKWIVPSMVDIVREALNRLRELTEPAREVARWCEAHPGQLYLPPEMEHLRRQEVITRKDIAAICGSDNQTTPFTQVLKLEPTAPRDKRGHLYAFKDVERALLRLMPEGFPVLDHHTGLKFSEALCVVRMNELIPSRSTHPSVVQPIIIVHVNGFLGAQPDTGTRSMFDRGGFTEPDGSRIAMTSHAFRHWLNTMAQKGGLSQIDIARWSGRKSVTQNQAYNHVTAEELLASIRDAAGKAGDIKVFGPMGEAAPRDPVARADYLKMQIPAAHTTDLGFCVHEFALTPCQIHGDCVNCSEHVVVKGDPRQKANTTDRLAEGEYALAKALEGQKTSQFGADRWTVHQTKTVERLRFVQKIHNDPMIPDGSIVQLSTPDMPSELRTAVEKRAEEEEDLQALLKTIRLG